MKAIGMLATLCAHNAKNGMRMPSATAAAKNRIIPTRAAPGARMNVVMAEAKLLKNCAKNCGTFCSQRSSQPARKRRLRRVG